MGMTVQWGDGQRLPSRRRISRARFVLVCASVVAVLGGGLLAASASALAPSILPEVIGTPKLGGRLQCNSGSWNGPVSQFYFTWIRDGSPIKGHEHLQEPAYELKKEDEGHEIWCVVWARGEGTEVSAESVNSVKWGEEKQKPEPPQDAEPPTASGVGEVGRQLTCSPGTWTGHPAPTLSYRWLRDEHEISPTQESSAYTVTGDDVGHTLQCKVIATNEVGEAFAISNGIHVKGEKPKGPAPKVEGTGRVGETLTCLHTGWTGIPEPTFSYQWQLEGKAIPGATGQTLLVEASFEGKQVSCFLTAENVEGKETATSERREINPKRPENTVPPEITGEAKVGRELTCSTGTWTGSPTFTYAWKRELKEGEELELSSSKTWKYLVVTADEAHALHCFVTAKNGGGEAIAHSKAFVIPKEGTHGEAPVPTNSLPGISGNDRVGERLSCSEGVWKGTGPLSYEYQWERDAKVSIQGATAKTYTVVEADEGHKLTCEVTAKNEYGTASAMSEPVPISGQAPQVTQQPSISGEGRLGESLVCLPGKWTGAPPPEFSYRWLRGEGSGQGSEIAGASGYVYKVQAADVGHVLTCVVTAHNSEGSETAEASFELPGGPPEPLEAPKITGSAQINGNLVCEEGRWNGAPLEPSFQWLLNGTPIPGATQKNLEVATAYRGQLLACQVTETNKQGHASAESAALRVPGIAPRNVIAPTIAGVGSLEAQLTCEHGIWEGAPPPAFTYQWYRDNSPIAGATGSTYIVEAADQGHLLVCVVTATNAEGRIEAESANVVPVLGHKAEIQNIPITTTPPTTAQVIALVRNAFVSQLPNTFHGLRLSTIRKKRGAYIEFTSPRPGTLEVVWFVSVKAAHHKSRRVILARGVRVYAKASRTSMHIVLTKQGEHMLKRAKRVKLDAEALFSVTGGPKVAWMDPFTLLH
jgi:hypothetical protein